MNGILIVGNYACLIQFCCAILDPMSNRDKIPWQIIKPGYLKKQRMDIVTK